MADLHIQQVEALGKHKVACIDPGAREAILKSGVPRPKFGGRNSRALTGLFMSIRFTQPAERESSRWNSTPPLKAAVYLGGDEWEVKSVRERVDASPHTRQCGDIVHSERTERLRALLRLHAQLYHSTTNRGGGRKEGARRRLVLFERFRRVARVQDPVSQNHQCQRCVVRRSHCEGDASGRGYR